MAVLVWVACVAVAGCVGSDEFEIKKDLKKFSFI
jgi:hypothetical protein